MSSSSCSSSALALNSIVTRASKVEAALLDALATIRDLLKVFFVFVFVFIISTQEVRQFSGSGSANNEVVVIPTNEHKTIVRPHTSTTRLNVAPKTNTTSDNPALPNSTPRQHASTTLVSTNQVSVPSKPQSQSSPSQSQQQSEAKIPTVVDTSNSTNPPPPNSVRRRSGSHKRNSIGNVRAPMPAKSPPLALCTREFLDCVNLITLSISLK